MGVQSLLELEYEPLHARERKISRMGFVRGRDIGRKKKGEGTRERARKMARSSEISECVDVFELR